MPKNWQNDEVFDDDDDLYDDDLDYYEDEFGLEDDYEGFEKIRHPRKSEEEVKGGKSVVVSSTKNVQIRNNSIGTNYL